MNQQNPGPAAPTGAANNSRNPFAESGLFVSTGDIWSPFKASLEGFAGGGKTTTMVCIAIGIWIAEGKTGMVALVDTERSAKFIVPLVRQFGLIEGKNFFVTHTRDLRRWGEVLKLCEQNRGSIFMTDTVTHVYEEMLLQFEKDNNRKVKYPQDAMIIKPMWKERFSNPFTAATNTHLLFTGRAAWEYTMMTDEDTGKKSFNATGVKMRGDNELAYEPDVVVLMEHAQKIENGEVMVARQATILKDRSRIIDGGAFIFPPFEIPQTDDPKERERLQLEADRKCQAATWKVFEPVYRMLSSGNRSVEPQTESDKAMGPLFLKGGGEAYYQAKLRAERITEEIGGVYNQWGLGGTGSVEKSVRAILNKLVYNSRSTVGLAELDPDVLHTGFETIEYLARYAAKNMDLIEKSHKAGQYEHIQEFLAEAKSKYLEEKAKAEHERQEEQDDDDIPAFDSKKPADNSISPDVDEALQHVRDCKSTADLDEIATQFEKDTSISRETRAFLDAAVEQRRGELKAGTPRRGKGKTAELGLS